MIFLKKPYIKSTKTKSKLIFELLIDNEEKKVWFEVDNEYKDYLCDDRVDAIFVGILSYALRNNHDIKSDSVITEDIIYKVERYLIPSLTKYSKDLHNIKIDIRTVKAIKNIGKVGTGCSCGIDSIHAILKNLNTPYKSFNLTHLSINNVGAFNECYKDAGIDKVRKERIKKSKEFAKDIGLPIIVTDSNFQTEIYQNHSQTHTYSSTFAILCMQKFWGKYYYGSSGYDFDSFNLKNNAEKDCSQYDLLSLDCFSTNNLKIISEGGALNRLEKTKEIYDNKLLKKYLHVCTIKETNCGLCPKCMRTILSLYALADNLDDYKNVFDVEYFNNHKEDYFEWLYSEHCFDSIMCEPIYNILIKKQEFYDFVHEREEERLKWIESQSKDSYKEKYESIINSKSFKITNKLLKTPRKIINLLKRNN